MPIITELPRKHRSEDAQPLYDEEPVHYVFKRRGCFPVSRSVFLLLLVEPYENLPRLIYYLYVPIAMVLFLVAELGFVLWFDVCCQPLMISSDQIGLYGKGKTFALEKVDPEDLKPNQQPPITTCLKLYNYCLETDRLTLESQQEDDEHDLEQQPDLVEGMEIQR